MGGTRKMPEGPRLTVGAEERREALLRVLRERRRLVKEALAARPMGPDPIDAAREQEEQAVWLSIVNTNRELQVQVDEAMERLARGEYGLCTDCGKPISVARLQALPFALRCRWCQECLEAERECAARSRSNSKDRSLEEAAEEEEESALAD